MPENPALEDFVRALDELLHDPDLSLVHSAGALRLRELTLEQVRRLMKDQGPGYYFLLAAAGLNRTSLKRESASSNAQVVAARLRKAYAVRERLPVRAIFSELKSSAVALRRASLERATQGSIEQLFRDRLVEEGIPLLMAPPIRRVPGVLIAGRKPDGVWPDPSTGAAPAVYLEIKNVKRVADDIQKRLYEIAETSIEMKVLYGHLKLDGFGLTTTERIVNAPAEIRASIRARIVATRPTVVLLALCPRAQAERYRAGAETFVDRVFFEEEVEECVAFLRAAIEASGGS